MLVIQIAQCARTEKERNTKERGNTRNQNTIGIDRCMTVEKNERTRKGGRKKLIAIQIAQAQRKKETEKKEEERQRRQQIAQSDKCAGTVST